MSVSFRRKLARGSDAFKGASISIDVAVAHRAACNRLALGRLPGGVDQEVRLKDTGPSVPIQAKFIKPRALGLRSS